MLEKMGWDDARRNFDDIILSGFSDFEKVEYFDKARYYFFPEERKVLFILKEIIAFPNNDPKLKKNKKYNEYKFIKVDFSKKKPKFVSKSCKSNIELLYLIRENLACDITYQRLFQINSIIK